MAEIIGRNLEVGVATEYTRGVVKASAERWIKRITTNLIEKVEKKIDESQMNKMEGNQNARIVKTEVNGSIEGNVQVDMINWLFYNLYGTDTETAVGTGAYSHALTLAQNIIHPSLSFFIKDGATFQKSISGCMVEDLELSFSAEDYVKFKASIIGKQINTNATTPAYSTEYDLIGRDVTVKFASTEAGLTGAVARKIKDGNIKWSANIIKEHNVGSYVNADFLNSELSIEGSLTGIFDDVIVKDYFTANTPVYMQIKIEGEATIGTTGKPTFTLLCNKVLIMNWERSGGNNDLVEEKYDFKAFYNTTDAKSSTVTIVNATATVDTPTSV